GGYVVNASSEKGRLAVNGMSNHDRGGINANSALIVTVTPEDFSGSSPLAGVEYQRKLEALAYEYGGGNIPVQLYGDFKVGKQSTAFGEIQPEFKGGFQFANLSTMLPSYLTEALIEGMDSFEHSIPGFARQDSILAGIESRTSSPVRIERNDAFESAQKGLFPCGEGAGYAGGITSAAMDGIKVAEEIGRRYLSFR
ncbi:MAG: FAD-dependent oxidoreductase, partial [Hungatella sp.]